MSINSVDMSSDKLKSILTRLQMECCDPYWVPEAVFKGIDNELRTALIEMMSKCGMNGYGSIQCAGGKD